MIKDLWLALRSLGRMKGLAATVVLTLALGIGVNAAIFSVVRGVLLRPLINRDEDRLVYIRQSAPGIAVENTTFSVPEIRDFREGVESVTAFGEFSTIDFTMVGLGEPRVVRAGVIDGSFFEVMGLRPVLGRLLGPADDGPEADGAAIMTHRFWTTALQSDPTVIGKTVRLGDRSATIVGVLEPSIPYPAETEIIANVVTSPHHMSATMEEGRVHRMTELFGRLAPHADLETALAELRAVHGAIKKEYPEAYPDEGEYRINAVRLRDQITSPARTVLLVLFAASALIFVIACSNVANLILARSVRREGELAIRASLGASAIALRRTLLAESLVLCGTGAILGVAVARPMVAILAQYAARFSVRALEVTVDASLLWVGVLLALAAAVFLAFVPRLPSADASTGAGLSNAGVRLTSGTNRRLRLFAVTQIAGVLRAPRRCGDATRHTVGPAVSSNRLRDAQRASSERAADLLRARSSGPRGLLPGGHATDRRAAGRGARGRRNRGPMARRRHLRSRISVLGGRLRQAGRRGRSPRTISDGFSGCFSRRSAFRSSPDVISARSTGTTPNRW